MIDAVLGTTAIMHHTNCDIVYCIKYKVHDVMTYCGVHRQDNGVYSTKTRTIRYGVFVGCTARSTQIFPILDTVSGQIFEFARKQKKKNLSRSRNR